VEAVLSKQLHIRVAPENVRYLTDVVGRLHPETEGLGKLINLVIREHREHYQRSTTLTPKVASAGN